MSNSIEDIKQNYSDIVKRENKISYIFSYGLPPILFILIFFVTITIDEGPGGSDSIGWAMAVSTIYPLIHLFVYLPKRTKQSNKKSAEGIFQKIGFEKMVIRDEIIYKNHKRYVEFFIFAIVFSVVMSLMLTLMLDNSKDQETGEKLTQEQLRSIAPIQNFFYSIPIVPGIMVYSYYLYRGPFSKYPDWNRFFSIGCFKILGTFEELSEDQKTHYTIQGLKHYDYFLRRNLKISISNVEILYTKLILDLSIRDYSGIILSKLNNNNKLELLKYLASLLKTTHDQDLISTSSSRSLKSIFPFLVSVIASLIAAGIVVIFQNLSNLD